MTVEKHIILGKYVGWISLLIGTALFFAYFFTSSNSIPFLAIGYVIFAGLMNTGLFIFILMRNSTIQSAGIYYLIKLAIFNIIMIALYGYAMLFLMNTMRITLINNNSSAFENIKIKGCEIKEVGQINSGKRKTIWINLKSDCEITIEYILDRKVKTETIQSYATPFSGGIIKHVIGHGETII